MQVNDLIFGFKVIRVRDNAELGGKLWELCHEATGAKVAWLDNGQCNKLFSIGFKTLPWDDTGVFHILEHSVLNGSEKYPVKEPFVNLLKSSLNTFLNAMTFPDKTMYPVASRNEQDFLNLTGVYLDAVFRPAIYHNPNIFYQEGWHYELAEQEHIPTYNGVVFNEMKGAFSSADTLLWNGMCRMLFPDSCYGYVSGGDPAHIPQLSYEAFLDAHRAFYHPGNSYTYLDGDLPVEKVLQMLAGYFDTYTQPAQLHTISMQGALPHQEATEYYEASADANVMLMAAQLISSWQDRQELMALSLLGRYLTGSNEAPLKKAILDSGIAQDAVIFVEDSIVQPLIGLEIRQLDVERKQELLALVGQFLATHQVDKEDLKADIDRMEFSLRDVQEPAAVSRAIMSMTTWLPGGDLLEGMTFSPLFDALRKNLEGDYFQQLLSKLDFTGDNTAVLTLIPSVDKGKENMAAQQQRLQQASKDWTEQDRENIRRLNRQLAAWQSGKDAPEDVAKLPMLPISQIDDQPEPIEAQHLQMHGRAVLLHKIPGQEVTHYYLAFGLADMTQEEFRQLSFLTNLLGDLPTATHTVAQLERLKKSSLAHLNFYISITSHMRDPQACRPYMVVSFSCLTGKQAQALALVREIMLTTQFAGADITKQIGIILSQCREDMYEGIIAGGNRYASLRAGSHWFGATALAEQTDGCAFYWYLKDLQANFQEKIGPLQAAMEALCQRVFCASRLTAGMVAYEQGAVLAQFIASLPAGEYAGEDVLSIPTDGQTCREAIIIPSGVSYAASSGLRQTAYHGSMDALTNLLNFDYLWNEVRVKGGAYGCGFRTSVPGGISFTTYRDPSPVASMELFPASGAFVEAFCKASTDLTQYIIGAAASQDPLMGNRSKLSRMMTDYFAGITHADRAAWRRQLLALSTGDLEKCASWLANTPYATCIVGSREAVEGCTGWTIKEL